MGKIYHDVTLELTPNVVVYPGDPKPEFRELKSVGLGDAYNLTSLTLTTHTGTHIDPPKHLIDDGLSVDKIDFSRLLGAAQVMEILGRDAINEEDLRKASVRPDLILLLKTDNSDRMARPFFDASFTYVTPNAARYLVDRRIKAFGFDYFSVDREDSAAPEAHNLFLGNGIPIIEGLDLRGIRPGFYEMAALPLRIKNGNGSPVRVVLIEEG